MIVTETARSYDYEDDDELWMLDVNGREEGHEGDIDNDDSDTDTAYAASRIACCQ